MQNQDELTESALDTVNGLFTHAWLFSQGLMIPL